MTQESSSLVAQRCHHHSEREAVARCPQCGLFFCRECVTEHEDRVVCARCLQKAVKRPGTTSRRFAGVGRLLASACGILAAWFFFYFIGRLLLLTPTSLHEGTLWEEVSDNK